MTYEKEKLLLFYDTETSGMPHWSMPSDDPVQPHIVQLAAALVGEKSRKTYQVINLTSKPSGWVIDPNTTRIHGIDNFMAQDVGVSEKAVISCFCLMVDRADIHIAHNNNFDYRIIRIAIKRFIEPQAPGSCDEWKAMDKYCTMNNSQKKINQKSLANCYQFFTNKPLQGAHNAMIDVKACMRVYFGLQDLGDTNV